MFSKSMNFWHFVKFEQENLKFRFQFNVTLNFFPLFNFLFNSFRFFKIILKGTFSVFKSNYNEAAKYFREIVRENRLVLLLLLLLKN